MTSNPEFLVAGSGVAVFFATFVLVMLTSPLVDSSDALVKAYDNFRYLENKRDSVDEARKRFGAWTAISLWGTGREDIPEFRAQGALIVGDPWLQQYREVCEYIDGRNPGLDRTKINDLTNNKALQRRVEFERVLADLQLRAASSFREVEDLRDPDAYMRRRKMFPYDKS